MQEDSLAPTCYQPLWAGLKRDTCRDVNYTPIDGGEKRSFSYVVHVLKRGKLRLYQSPLCGPSV